ncbi:Site-specific recombinase XerD [Burkholderia sp. GAS332]|nr:Site-specific recombinase XerD [Burkholderia sp. GAS332]
MDSDPRHRLRLFLRRSTTADGTACMLVTDADGCAHRPLSHFIRFAGTRYAPTTVSVYAHALIRYFSWLIAGQRKWDIASERVRAHCMLFLGEIMRCHAREHRGGFVAVNTTVANSAQVRAFLAAARAFYQFAIDAGLYDGPDPLSRIHETVDGATRRDSRESYPSMPLASGVQSPARAPGGRHTSAYFVLVNERWVPQIIDDPLFARRVLDAGRQVGWCLRDQLITRLLFETGARISEVCGLTLGDWHSRGLRCEVSAFSKGSGQRRVKTLRFSETSAKLLRRYVDHDRRASDDYGWRLADYLLCAESAPWYTRPLFLTAHHTPLTAGTFRDLAWRPACRQAGISANIHQARHWYVTQAMRAIYSTIPDGTARERAIDALIVYMNWRSGRATLERYDHYFCGLKHADVQATLHAQIDRTLRSRRAGSDRPSTSVAPHTVPDIPAGPDWQLLQRLGGGTDETEP